MTSYCFFIGPLHHFGMGCALWMNQGCRRLLSAEPLPHLFLKLEKNVKNEAGSFQKREGDLIVVENSPGELDSNSVLVAKVFCGSGKLKSFAGGTK